MKIKPAQSKGGVIMKLGTNEAQLPDRSAGNAPAVLPAFKLKKILVPVDFTGCTKEALLYAIPFARQFDAEVTLLHVVEPPFLPTSEMATFPDQEAVEGATEELKRLRDRFDGEVRCQTEVRRGSARFEIVAAAKELDSDLIILSTHGRTGVERFLLGSTTEQVARYAACPLLVVRPHEREFVTPEAAGSAAREKAAEAEIEAEMTAGM